MQYLPKKKQWVLILLIGVLLIVIAMPTKLGTTQKENNDYGMAQRETTEMELRLESLLSNMQDVGQVQVMMTYNEDDRAEGIVILAEGAKNAVTIRKITEVVQALFDVDLHKIKVIESNFHN